MIIILCKFICFILLLLISTFVCITIQKIVLTFVVPDIISSKIYCTVWSDKVAKYQSMFVEGMFTR